MSRTSPMSREPWESAPVGLELAPDEVHVWRIRLVRPAEVVARLGRTLAPEERAKAARFRFEKDRDQYTVGRGTLRAILGRYLEIEPARLEFRSEAYGKPALGVGGGQGEGLRFNLAHSHGLALLAVARRRRSALAFDGWTAIEAEAFLAMLDRLLPRPDVPPWDALTWPPKVHAGLFVHRVRGLVPGFYLFERHASVHDRLRAEVRDGLAWERPPGCPDHLRLFRLARQDLRDASRILSCHQTVASHGAFSLGMIADFGDTIRSGGAWWYRRLFWEAGMLGQVLYLEAEAAGVRGTGIGCYFDDAFHDLLGLSGDRFQDLYHFTVGAPVDDPRLTTLPPYGHLDPVPGPA
jgi:hypothetical protein